MVAACPQSEMEVMINESIIKLRGVNRSFRNPMGNVTKMPVMLKPAYSTPILLPENRRLSLRKRGRKK
jgi:hypothetical protein